MSEQEKKEQTNGTIESKSLEQKAGYDQHHQPSTTEYHLLFLNNLTSVFKTLIVEESARCEKCWKGVGRKRIS